MTGSDDVGETISVQLRRLRRLRGLTQEELADRADLSRDLVAKLEQGRRRTARISSLASLARALDVELSALVESATPMLEAQEPGRELRAHADMVPDIEPLVDARLSGVVWDRTNPSGTISPAIAELCNVLTDYGFDDSRLDVKRSVQKPLAMRDLKRDLTTIFDAYQQSRFTIATTRVSRLLADAKIATRNHVAGESGEAYGVLALSYQAAASVLIKAGESDLAWIAAERGTDAAKMANDSAIRGSLVRSVAFSLLSTGRLESAMRLIESGARLLEPELGRESRISSVYGMLFLVGAMAAARSGDAEKTAGYLQEADRAAHDLGHDGNHLWTAFGPTNVAIHRVNTAAELGDIGAVLNSAVPIYSLAVPVERKVRYLLDIARAYAFTGKREEALGTILCAERMAPEQVCQHHLTKKVVMTLIQGARGRPIVELETLARRINLATAC